VRVLIPRKIGEALDLVGLSSDELLLHGNERVVYGIPLATNYKELLLGLTKRPKHIVPQSDKKERTRTLFAYWCKRWLFSRIKNSDLRILREGPLLPLAQATNDGLRCVQSSLLTAKSLVQLWL